MAGLDPFDPNEEEEKTADELRDLLGKDKDKK